MALLTQIFKNLNIQIQVFHDTEVLLISHHIRNGLSSKSLMMPGEQPQKKTSLFLDPAIYNESLNYYVKKKQIKFLTPPFLLGKSWKNKIKIQAQPKHSD